MRVVKNGGEGGPIEASSLTPPSTAFREERQAESLSLKGEDKLRTFFAFSRTSSGDRNFVEVWCNGEPRGQLRVFRNGTVKDEEGSVAKAARLGAAGQLRMGKSARRAVRC